MADLNSTDIESNAENPKRVTVDGNTVEQFPVKDQLDAAYFKASKAAMDNDKRGLAINLFKASGSQ